MIKYEHILSHGYAAVVSGIIQKRGKLANVFLFFDIAGVCTDPDCMVTHPAAFHRHHKNAAVDAVFYVYGTDSEYGVYVGTSQHDGRGISDDDPYPVYGNQSFGYFFQ